MTDRPILFLPAMVRALLAGTKPDNSGMLALCGLLGLQSKAVVMERKL